jgi:hypothetical protein
MTNSKIRNATHAATHYTTLVAINNAPDNTIRSVTCGETWIVLLNVTRNVTDIIIKNALSFEMDKL